MTIMTLEVKSVAPDEGKHGPQWKLEYMAPFSDYPLTGWITRIPGQDVKKGTYMCDILRGKARNGKEESPNDYDYNWKIVAFDVSGDNEYKPSAPTDDAKAAFEPSPESRWHSPEPTFEQARMDVETVKRHSIHRQVALKAAVELFCTDSPYRESIESTILELADNLFDWLQEQPSQAPSKATEPDSEAGPSEAHIDEEVPLFIEDGDQPNYGADGEPQKQFATAGDLRRALSSEFGLASKQQCDDAFGGDINKADRAQVYATIKAARQEGK